MDTVPANSQGPINCWTNGPTTYWTNGATNHGHYFGHVCGTSRCSNFATRCHHHLILSKNVSINVSITFFTKVDQNATFMKKNVEIQLFVLWD